MGKRRRINKDKVKDKQKENEGNEFIQNDEIVNDTTSKKSGKKRRKIDLNDTPTYNLNYAYLFNREMYEFFTRTGPNDLENGYITVNGSFEAVNYTENSSIVGSYWTSDEKNEFFELLSRYSRHNLASIARDIGSKSLLEVEEYHDLLFTASRDQKLLELIEFPASQEMSQDWIEMEEEQAKLIQKYEEKLEEGRNIEDDDSVEDNNLLDKIELLKSSRTIRDTELAQNEKDVSFRTDTDPSLSISEKSLEYLERHVKDLTIFILKTAYLTRVQQARDMLGTSFSKHKKKLDKQAMRSIDENDVLETCRRLGIVGESRLMRKRVREDDETVDNDDDEETSDESLEHHLEYEDSDVETSDAEESEKSVLSDSSSIDASDELITSNQNHSFTEYDIDEALITETNLLEAHDSQTSSMTEQLLTKFIQTGDFSNFEKLCNISLASSSSFSKIPTHLLAHESSFSIFI